jgi:hypothetical protein
LCFPIGIRISDLILSPELLEHIRAFVHRASRTTLTHIASLSNLLDRDHLKDVFFRPSEYVCNIIGSGLAVDQSPVKLA